MDSDLTCILVLVSMLTTRSCEYTQKYQYSANNLITNFRNLSNRMFLFINCNLRVVFSLFPKFSWVARCEMVPRRPIKPPFDTLVAEKLRVKHARIKNVCFSDYFAYAYKTRVNSLAL